MNLPQDSSAPPTTPAAPTAPAAKKQNPLVRVGIGCLGLVGIGCIAVGAFAFYENWQQEQNYQAGHTAYLAADCAAAVGPLDKAASGEPGTKDSDVARTAEAELTECQTMLDAEALVGQGNPGDAVMAYNSFLDTYASSPLRAAALSKGQDIVASTDAEALISPDLCPAIDSLVSSQFITSPAESVPQLSFACGQAFEGAEAYGDALLYYERILGEFPDHALASDAQAAYARATIAEARAVGAGELPAPQAVGESDGSGVVTVIIRNDSPKGLSMVFSGPEVRVERIEPCTDCEEFSGDGPAACPNLGPVGTYELPAGDYEVVVKAAGDDGVTPFRGTWTLEAGQEYESCFYLVTS